jgi:ubiquinone/menaquinone biosynthesis C-methylase UbiE
MSDHANANQDYLPAAGHDWALPLYDPLIRLMGLDRTRDVLIDQADIGGAQHVLEIGCGTGTLLARVKRRHPGATVAGLDPDPKALGRASRKCKTAGLTVQLDRGYSDQMPYADMSFDRILSSFMFHHLSGAAKAATLREVLRVLRPGGSLHLVDFAGSSEGRGFLMRVFHADDAMIENANDRVIARMRETGFSAAARVLQERRLLGQVRLNYYRALR